MIFSCCVDISEELEVWTTTMSGTLGKRQRHWAGWIPDMDIDESTSPVYYGSQDVVYGWMASRLSACIYWEELGTLDSDGRR